MLRWIKKHFEIEFVARYEDLLPWRKLNWREINIFEVYFENSFNKHFYLTILILNFGIILNYYANNYKKEKKK